MVVVGDSGPPTTLTFLSAGLWYVDDDVMGPQTKHLVIGVSLWTALAVASILGFGAALAMTGNLPGPVASLCKLAAPSLGAFARILRTSLVVGGSGTLCQAGSPAAGSAAVFAMFCALIGVLWQMWFFCGGLRWDGLVEPTAETRHVPPRKPQLLGRFPDRLWGLLAPQPLSELHQLARHNKLHDF